MGIRRVQMEMRGDLPVLQRQHQLHQPSHPGRHLQMADIGLHRADIKGISAPAKDNPQRADLNRITKRRPRAVGLDLADLIRR